MMTMDQESKKLKSSPTSPHSFDTVKLEMSPIRLTPLDKEHSSVTKSVGDSLGNMNVGTQNILSSGKKTRKIQPLQSLNPYMGSWCIFVRVTHKSQMRSFKKEREGSVFTVEFIDKDGTQIAANMFNEAAEKFYPIFEVGKSFYVSGGNMRMANKKFNTLKNDYEIILNQHSNVEVVDDNDDDNKNNDGDNNDNKIFKFPNWNYNFVKFDSFSPFVGGRALIDVIGIVKNVNNNISLRRKKDGEEISKREITLCDQTNKTVSISLWGDLSLNNDKINFENLNDDVVIALNAMRVSDYQGVSLSSTSRTLVELNPKMKETDELNSWYNSEGKNSEFEYAGNNLQSNNSKFYSQNDLNENRTSLSDITMDKIENGKPIFINSRAVITLIRSDQPLIYQACKKCNKKVTVNSSGDFWCESCQTNSDSFSYRYIMTAKVSDPTGEVWVSIFSDQATPILGITADEIAELREKDESAYKEVFKKATWKDYLFRFSAASNEYNGEKRLRITVKNSFEVDWSQECALMIRQIEQLKNNRVGAK